MKKAIFISATLLIVMVAGCERQRIGDEGLIIVDITESYSSKKKMILQDFMDVEYIALETNDNFINQGFIQDIGKEIILVTNRNDDGDIFIYDRTGKALRKINRKGQSGEEYSNIWNITLDEENNEMFVNSHLERKISVYDLYGNFKRSFKHNEGTGYFFYTEIFNYDKNQLICNNEYSEEIGFILISKQDGTIIKEINIPFKEKKLLVQYITDKTNNSVNSALPGPYRTIIPYKGDWMLLELSSDTVYTLLPDYRLRPFLVRTPPIQFMVPEKFLILRLFSDRYCFMETIQNVYDWNTKSGFPKTYFMYDIQEKIFSGYTVYNGDFSTPKEIYMSMTSPVNHEIESWYPLQAHELVYAYEKGQLKGKLKDIAATLDEDSNPVIMLIKHKKQ